MDTIYRTVTIKTTECCSCGVTFGMPADLYDARRNDHGYFYCPNGHGQHFTGKSEAEKLREELLRRQAYFDQREAQLRDQRDNAKSQRDHAERQKAAARGQVTKIKNRVGNGVCPCCKRTVSQLARHMETKHPDFKAPEK